MNTLIRIFSIALIAGAALVSCGKITPTGGNEQGGETPGGETGGGDEPGGNTDPDVTTRVLSVSFDTEATRTYLGDNGYPYFEENDVILLATTEGEARTEECTVYYRNGVAMIQTSLPGVLRAVYPVGAAVLKNNRIDGVKVPAVQTGLFKDANICMVDEIPVDATKVTFLNQTAIFAVTVPANTDQIEVTSLNVITDDLNPWDNVYGFRTDSKVKINNDEESDDYYSIIVKPESGDNWSMNNTSGDEDDPYAGNSVYYVSVLTARSVFEQSKNVRLIDLNFDTISKPSGDSGDIVRKMGGFSPKLLIKGMHLAMSQTVSYYEFAQASSLYVLPYSSLHDYVEIDGLKWATMNVGASSPSDPGYYFPWAGVDGHQYIDGSWTYDEDLYFIVFDPDLGFSDTSGPYYDASYTKYYDGDGVTSLALWDDAAYMNWGGAWRMPTLSDMEFFGTIDPYTQCSYTNGYFELTVGGSTLIFPESGSAEGADPPSMEEETDLWLATLDPEDNDCAYYLAIQPQNYTFIFSYGVYGGENITWFRYSGMNVRPVSGVYTGGGDDSDDGGLTIDPYTPIDMSTNISL